MPLKATARVWVAISSSSSAGTTHTATGAPSAETKRPPVWRFVAGRVDRDPERGQARQRGRPDGRGVLPDPSRERDRVQTAEQIRVGPTYALTRSQYTSKARVAAGSPTARRARIARMSLSPHNPSRPPRRLSSSSISSPSPLLGPSHRTVRTDILRSCRLTLPSASLSRPSRRGCTTPSRTCIASPAGVRSASRCGCIDVAMGCPLGLWASTAGGATCGSPPAA